MSITNEALFFPLKKGNMQMFLCLFGLFVLQFAIMFLPVIGLITFVFLGYIYATQFKIIFTTGNGYAGAPEFPDFGDLFENILSPILKVVLIWIIGFAPAIVITSTVYVSDLVAELLFYAAYLYIPIGMMIAAMDDFVKIFNPAVIIHAIRASGLAYFAMVAGFVGFNVVSGLFEELFPASWILSSLIGAYGIMFTGRLIGAVYRDRLADDIFETSDELA